jgi:hypothetical protein
MSGVFCLLPMQMRVVLETVFVVPKRLKQKRGLSEIAALEVIHK